MLCFIIGKLLLFPLESTAYGVYFHYTYLLRVYFVGYPARRLFRRLPNILGPFGAHTIWTHSGLFEIYFDTCRFTHSLMIRCSW